LASLRFHEIRHFADDSRARDGRAVRAWQLLGIHTAISPTTAFGLPADCFVVCRRPRQFPGAFAPTRRAILLDNSRRRRACESIPVFDQAPMGSLAGLTGPPHSPQTSFPVRLFLHPVNFNPRLRTPPAAFGPLPAPIPRSHNCTDRRRFPLGIVPPKSPYPAVIFDFPASR